MYVCIYDVYVYTLHIHMHMHMLGMSMYVYLPSSCSPCLPRNATVCGSVQDLSGYKPEIRFRLQGARFRGLALRGSEFRGLGFGVLGCEVGETFAPRSSKVRECLRFLGSFGTPNPIPKP